MMRANGLFAEEEVKPFRGKATKGGWKNDFLRKVMLLAAAASWSP
jgi:hypothetical protein